MTDPRRQLDGEPEMTSSRRQMALSLLSTIGAAAMLKGCAEDSVGPGSTGEHLLAPAMIGALTGTSAVRWFDTAAELGAAVGAAHGEVALLFGYHAAGDGGGGVFRWDAQVTTTSDSGFIFGQNSSGRWMRVHDLGPVDVRWFGARGDDDQTLISTNYQSDVTLTQQTRDGLAFNSALRYLRAIGGGAIHIPRGLYRVYGYVETIDFPCRITGDGMGVTVLKNCDSSPWAHGYGIFRIFPASLADISLSALTIDGNGTARSAVAAEVRAYPLAIYGIPRVVLSELESRNSPIDCLLANYSNAEACSLRAVNCLFSNSFRNTVSLCAGWNQQFTNCLIEKGGKVQGGTNPAYCLDIEPDSPTATIRNITFSNCIFREAQNAIAGGVWAGNVRFEGCSFFAYGSTVPGYPWLGVWTGGQFSFVGCSFKETSNHRGSFRIYNENLQGEFAATQFVEIRACEFEGCGIAGYGPNMRLTDVTVVNSRFPVLFEGLGLQRVNVKNMTLVNVIDSFNAGSGTVAGFAVHPAVEGHVEVDGLSVRVEPSLLPSTFTAPSMAYGIYVAPTLSSTVEMKVSNVHVAGYYRKLPAALGATANANQFRDWGSPGLAPPDGSGQTAGPGAAYYRNCTMYGDSP